MENKNNEVVDNAKEGLPSLTAAPEAFLTKKDCLYAEVEGIAHLGVTFVRAGIIAPATIREQIVNAHKMMNELLPGAMTSEIGAATMWGFNYGAVAMVWQQLITIGYVIKEQE